MISKLPRWVWVGSALLAVIAGCINAVGYLSFQHQGVTHVTGSTTLLAIAVAGQDGGQAVHFLGVLVAFMAGCVISAAIVEDEALQLGRSYGIALAIESALLFCAVPLLEHTNVAGAYLASCACGLQNGLVSHYSGAILRTTHLTGALTDLGIYLGHRFRRRKLDPRRMKLCALIIAGFLVGAALGAIGFERLEYKTLYLPAAAVGGVGLAYAVYAHTRMGNRGGR
jgi:uncharacterized membrane protein YoaK (UPF0700 family)